MMRRLLDQIYRTSGALAAVFLVAIFVVVLIQVGANLINALSGAALRQSFGLSLPSYADFAGYSLAATTFLALAYTLRAGAHIRVSLVIDNVSGRRRRLVELWCAACGTAVAGYFAYFSILMVADSLAFGDVSPGMVPIPLWLPQSAMALGLVILTIALADEFVSNITGRVGAHGRQHEPDVAMHGP